MGHWIFSTTYKVIVNGKKIKSWENLWSCQVYISGSLGSPKECNIFEQEVCLSRLLISLFIIIILLLLEMKICINKIKYHISGGTKHPKYLSIIGLQQKYNKRRGIYKVWKAIQKIVPCLCQKFRTKISFSVHTMEVSLLKNGIRFSQILKQCRGKIYRGYSLKEEC